MLLIYLTTNSSRCSYVLDLIFKEELGLAFKTCADIQEFERFSGEKINYSHERIGDEFFIKSNSICLKQELKSRR